MRQRHRAFLIAALLALLALLALSASASAGQPPLFRISIENVPGHFQARTVARFAELLSERAGGELRVRLYDSAKLFRDSEVVAALGRGDVEMAFPGIWQLDRYAPDAAVLMLPSLMGRGPEEYRRLADGPLGKKIGAQIERATRTVIVGPWLDLGYGLLFSARPIRSEKDIGGKRFRTAGGRANEERLRALGAKPVSIPFLDLPDYLRQGLLDGSLTTYETVDSSRLDREGLVFAYEDKEYYPFYLPIVSRRRWEGLSERVRGLIAATWEELVPSAREESRKAQEEAKSRLLARGLSLVLPSPAEIAATRSSLQALEPSLVGRLGISDEVYALMREEVGKF